MKLVRSLVLQVFEAHRPTVGAIIDAHVPELAAAGVRLEFEDFGKGSRMERICDELAVLVLDTVERGL